MCKFASFVLTKDRVFYSRNSSSHNDIISEHDLHEGTIGRVNIVKVEISPTKSWADLATWSYKVDQDMMPKWFDATDCERRTREALANLLSGAEWLKPFDKFLASIPKIKWMKNGGKPLKAWKVFKTWDAAGAAAHAAARDAAGAAAGAAALAAACDAAGAAARDAAGAAAGAAAWAAARDAAGAAARDAACDAELMALMILAGTGLAKENMSHIKSRLDVWRKGYGLLCDVNGVLYVYESLL
jgi:hypothetical protein